MTAKIQFVFFILVMQMDHRTWSGWIVWGLGFVMLYALACKTIFKRDAAFSVERVLPSEESLVFPSIAFPSLEGKGNGHKKGKEKYLSKEILTKGITNRHPDRRGRPLISRLRARELIRETLVRKGKPLVRIILKGRAVLYHSSIRIQARHIVIENGNYGILKGRVRLYDPQSRLRLYAKEAHYWRDRHLLILRGNPYILRSSASNGTIRISCQIMQYFLKEKRSELKGGVRANHLSWNMFADRGIYLDATRTLTLEKQPVLMAENRYLTGDLLVYQENKGLAELKGNAVFYWRRPSKLLSSPAASRKSKLPGLEEYVRRGGRVGASVPRTKKEKPETQALAVLTTDRLQYSIASYQMEADGNVVLTQQEMRLTAAKLRMVGKHLPDIHAEGGVYAIDRQRRTEMRAGNMHYQGKRQWLVLKEEPVFSFYSSSGDKTVTVLSGGLIERDFQKKLIRAQSRVTLSQRNYQAVAELATYYEDAQVLIMEGDPVLHRQGSFVRAERILIYPNKDRMLFHNRVQGSFSYGH